MQDNSPVAPCDSKGVLLSPKFPALIVVMLLFLSGLDLILLYEGIGLNEFRVLFLPEIIVTAITIIIGNYHSKVFIIRGQTLTVNGFFWGTKEMPVTEISGYKIRNLGTLAKVFEILQVLVPRASGRGRSLVLMAHYDEVLFVIEKRIYSQKDISEFLGELKKHGVENLGQETTWDGIKRSIKNTLGSV